VTQLPLLDSEGDSAELPARSIGPFKTQLLKWIGNKQRFAHEIVSYFPLRFGKYIEPFIGSGAVLGTLAPRHAMASDALAPLIELWRAVAENPEAVAGWYTERWERTKREGKVAGYEAIKVSYNARPNAADLLFIARACYGGVVRFRRKDGGISTPCGVHEPVSPESFRKRLDIWHRRVRRTRFVQSDFEPVMDAAEPGDMIYCDPPYTHTQAILYGAQAFDLRRLFATIERCKARGIHVALSIDGTKRSGAMLCHVRIPPGLFEREAMVNCGRSMLLRFQMKGETLESEHVRDRLLLTY
jgi:DNA adenine methylase